MQAGRVVDADAGFPAACCQQRDADQAYVEAWLNGTETCIAQPHAVWPPAWFHDDGTPKYDTPEFQLLRAL